MSLMLPLKKTWADGDLSHKPVTAAPTDYSCLKREEKEKIHTVFACHAALDTVTTPAPAQTGWKSIAMYIAIGFVSGMIVQAQISR